jgi:hypothetical protein
MAVGLSARVRIGRRWRISRQAAALVAICAILFQAAAFACHHHAAPFHSRAASAVAILAAPISPVVPASADDECQICLTISHNGAVPVDFYAAQPPENPPLHQARTAAVDAPLIPYLLFRSRAPPSA